MSSSSSCSSTPARRPELSDRASRFRSGASGLREAVSVERLTEGDERA